ncbi:hypothetical protein C8D83_10441 [Halothiobacillus neapolitanus]|nr:hypothetical protein C8D83_10441 [Halothiobacillus neapolitanus]
MLGDISLNPDMISITSGACNEPLAQWRDALNLIRNPRGLSPPLSLEPRHASRCRLDRTHRQNQSS